MENWKGSKGGEDGESAYEKASGAWGQSSTWGEATAEGSGGWGDVKYKLPHILSLEDKNRKEAIEW
jgi:hypothetical protein